MKKQLLFVLAFVLFAALGSNAQSTHSSILFKHHNTLVTPDVALNKASAFHANLSQIGMSEMGVGGEKIAYSRGGRYEDALHKRNAGIGLTAAGGTCLIAGSALIAVGAIGWQNDLNGNGSDLSPLNHTLEIAFGTILALAGTGMTIPGAILLAKGQQNMKKFKAAQSVN